MIWVLMLQTTIKMLAPVLIAIAAAILIQLIIYQTTGISIYNKLNNVLFKEVR